MRNFTIFKKNYFSFLVLLQPYNPYGKNGKNGIKTQAWSILYEYLTSNFSLLSNTLNGTLKKF